MVLLKRRSSLTGLHARRRFTRFWTNWWTGILIWSLAFAVARFFGPLASLGVAFWLFCEAVNSLLFHAVFVPRLTRFTPSDAHDLTRGLVSEASFEAAIDNVCFLLAKDPGHFWQRVTGIANIDRVPVATALSFVKSLLFVFDHDDDEEDEDGQEGGGARHKKKKSEKGSGERVTRESMSAVRRAMDRIGDAGGGFATNDDQLDPGFEESSDGELFGSPFRRRGGRLQNKKKKKKKLSVPNLIQGWTDDQHLRRIVRSTPLVLNIACFLTSLATFAVLRLAGWRPGPDHSHRSGVQCWVYEPKPATDGKPSEKRLPLVLLPGAGAGLTSFVPFLLFLQRRYRGGDLARTLVVYRLPWVEVGRPWSHLPQWGAVVRDMNEGLCELLGPTAAFDVVAHSYGTAVVNRFLRSLCDAAPPQRSPRAEAEGGRGGRSRSKGRSRSRSRSRSKSGSARRSPRFKGGQQEEAEGLRVHYLAIVDPIVLGGASTGLVGVINQGGPDLSFAFCANRAGVTFKEIIDYDPAAYGQCLGGLGVYMSEGDVLLDMDLATHILAKHVTCPVDVVVDRTPRSLHGRWLVELWLTASLGPRLGVPKAGGLLARRFKWLDQWLDKWVAPCTARFLLLMRTAFEHHHHHH